MASSFAIRIYGFVFLAVGVSNIVLDYFTRIRYSSPQDLGVITSDCAILFIAGITLAIAKGLQQLEHRLDKLEAKK
jgi:hypothetical protein